MNDASFTSSIASQGSGTVTGVELTSYDNSIAVDGSVITRQGKYDISLPIQTAPVAGQYLNPILTVNDRGVITNIQANSTSGVTSVGAISPKGTLQVTGSPITNVGTLSVDLLPQTNVSGYYTSANITVNDYGVITSVTSGTNNPGNGTVTRVGVNSNTLRVTASPVISAGDIDVNLNVINPTYPKTIVFPTITVDEYGRVTSAVPSALKSSNSSIQILSTNTQSDFTLPQKFTFLQDVPIPVGLKINNSGIVTGVANATNQIVQKVKLTSKGETIALPTPTTVAPDNTGVVTFNLDLNKSIPPSSHDTQDANSHAWPSLIQLNDYGQVCSIGSQKPVTTLAPGVTTDGTIAVAILDSTSTVDSPVTASNGMLLVAASLNTCGLAKKTVANPIITTNDYGQITEMTAGPPQTMTSTAKTIAIDQASGTIGANLDLATTTTSGLSTTVSVASTTDITFDQYGRYKTSTSNNIPAPTMYLASSGNIEIDKGASSWTALVDSKITSTSVLQYSVMPIADKQGKWPTEFSVGWTWDPETGGIRLLTNGSIGDFYLKVYYQVWNPVSSLPSIEGETL